MSNTLLDILPEAQSMQSFRIKEHASVEDGKHGESSGNGNKNDTTRQSDVQNAVNRERDMCDVTILT